MKFLSLFSAIATLVPAIFAGPLGVSVDIQSYSGDKTGRHIVTLKDGVSRLDIINQVKALLAGKPGTGVTNEFDAVFNGFAGTLDDVTLAALRLMPGVSSIAEDGVVHATATQPDAPWGLGRISSHTPPPANLESGLNSKYNYDERAGHGVTIYVLDTGVHISHNDFGGRARHGPSFVSTSSEDGHGHGTHCAGTAIGTRYGVAKNAQVEAVKVLADDGSGSIISVLLGMEHVAIRTLMDPHTPKVVSMSLGGGASDPLDMAARKLVERGVHVVVAAGNANADANTTSLARVAEVITVGASTIEDKRAFFSNYGPGVDVFAPGYRVISAWIGSDNATNNISGTSMATPHIAGLVAYLISVHGNMKPEYMAGLVKKLAHPGVLSDIPDGTPNLLAFNGHKA
ncbi:hypothetical protein NMY22_g10943 [Coprinellus aureogranulatus]|nr:hypothetical protein NMY22_g10943 [Coprinellus aureogranulatus]